MAEAIVMAQAPTLSPDLLLKLHRTMLRIRIFEERTGELVEAKEINTPTHLYIGQEAVATGVCAALRPNDFLLGNHRSHGHFLAKGGSMRALMAELFCRATGCAKGRGGSMHLFDSSIGVLGTVPMVAGTIPVAVGAALSARLRKSDQVSVAFFGDGATEEGVFFESVNFAALHKLPVLFVCENNFMSSHLPIRDRRTVSELVRVVSIESMSSVAVDGNDVAEVFQASNEAAVRARRGEGPTFLECNTYRWRGHVGPRDDLDVGIRDPQELASWIARCPILQVERSLIDAGAKTQRDFDRIREEVRAEVEDAVEFARTSPEPEPSHLADHVYSGHQE